jgi:DNA adenine methylase
VLTDVPCAARFFYLQQQAFGGRVQGQTQGSATTAPAINLLRIEENLSGANLRLASAYIEQLDWATCLDRYDRTHTLFYIDPPYWETEGYGVPFEWSQYELMATKLRRIKSKAIISLTTARTSGGTSRASAWRSWPSTTPWAVEPTGPSGRS